LCPFLAQPRPTYQKKERTRKLAYAGKKEKEEVRHEI
jgi:hypothetical protein